MFLQAWWVPGGLEISLTSMATIRALVAHVMPGYYLTSTAQSYEGEYQWLIELEKGWSAWLPGNEPRPRRCGPSN